MVTEALEGRIGLISTHCVISKELSQLDERWLLDLGKREKDCLPLISNQSDCLYAAKGFNQVDWQVFAANCASLGVSEVKHAILKTLVS